MKYEVECHELCWYNTTYLVEADSEEDAREIAEEGDGELLDSNYDCLDQSDVVRITPIE